MFYHYLYPLGNAYPFLNLFKYLTFRTIGALLTALLISFLLGERFILWLKKLQKEGQPIREDGPLSHFNKKGTPTMGGGLILLSLGMSTFLWADWGNPFIPIIFFTTFMFGALGAYDDFLKLRKKNHKGLSGKKKILFQLIFALLTSIFLLKIGGPASLLTVPFFKSIILDFGYFYLILSVFIIVGSSNAVNLTDGLDGLAIGPVIITCICFCLISYLVGHLVFSRYLQILHVPYAGELSVFLGSLIGAGLGFLWYNTPPARVFMGDTGSLAMGASLGTVAIITKHEIVLAIIGGLFVIEAISVILQVGYFKFTKKRIFLMAPIHHHFEKKGWSEPTVVIRFWIISIILALIGLSTLKLR